MERTKAQVARPRGGKSKGHGGWSMGKTTKYGKPPGEDADLQTVVENANLNRPRCKLIHHATTRLRLVFYLGRIKLKWLVLLR